MSFNTEQLIRAERSQAMDGSVGCYLLFQLVVVQVVLCCSSSCCLSRVGVVVLCVRCFDVPLPVFYRPLTSLVLLELVPTRVTLSLLHVAAIEQSHWWRQRRDRALRPPSVLVHPTSLLLLPLSSSC